VGGAGGVLAWWRCAGSVNVWSVGGVGAVLGGGVRMWRVYAFVVVRSVARGARSSMSCCSIVTCGVC
jgi:hypothetical protein